MRLFLLCISYVLIVLSGCQSNSNYRQRQIEGDIRSAISQGKHAEVINQLILQADDPSKAAVAGVWEIMYLEHIPDQIKLTWAYYQEKPPSSTRCSEIFEVINRYKISVLRVLIHHGVDVNRHYYGSPLVMWGCPGWGTPPMTPSLLAFLLENGYNPNLNGDFQSALDFCACPGQSFLKYEQKYEMMKMLLKHGANPNVISGGKPILHQLATPYQRDNPCLLEMIQLLLDEGADVNFLNEEGKTPLDTAMQYRSHPPGKDELVNKIIHCLESSGGNKADEIQLSHK
jgi:hypothetical protein